MSIVTIYGNDEEVLSTKLIEILNCFSNHKSLSYTIKYLEGVSSDTSFNQLEFEEKIKNSSEGLSFTYEQIVELEKNSHQFIEMELMVINTNKLQGDLCSCQLAKVSLIDGSYWEVDFPHRFPFDNLMKLEGAKITINEN